MTAGTAARLAAAALSGALVVLALAPHGRSWLAWVALVPLFVALSGATARATIALTVVYTIAFALGGLEPWFARATAAYFDVRLGRMVLLTAPPLVLLAIAHGVALGTMLVWARPRRRGAWDVVWCGALWVWWEMLRTVFFPYYPAAFLALTQATAPPILQVASVTGVAGISFVVAACNVAVASLVAARGEGDGVVAALAGLVLVAAVAGAGAARLARAPDDGPAGLRVVALDVDAAERGAGTLERYLAGSAGIPPQSALLIWPESALTTDVEHDREAWRRLAALVAAHGVPLLAGGPGSARRDGGGALHFNSAHLVLPGHGMRSYHKRGLVPFAERWPPLATTVFGPPPPDLVSLDAGTEPTVFRLGDTAFGVLICFEITGARGARELVRGGARFLVNITNDAWFLGAGRPPHLPWAALRAVETGVPVLRAANAGPSAVFDRFGRARATSRAALLSAVVPDGEPTVYTRHGDVFLAVCLAVVLVGVAARWRARRTTGPR